MAESATESKEVRCVEGGNIIEGSQESESIEGLFDYAAKHWGTHFRLGNISSPSSCFSIPTDGQKDYTLLAKAAALCDASTSVFRAWFQPYWDTGTPSAPTCRSPTH